MKRMLVIAVFAAVFGLGLSLFGPDLFDTLTPFFSTEYKRGVLSFREKQAEGVLDCRDTSPWDCQHGWYREAMKTWGAKSVGKLMAFCATRDPVRFSTCVQGIGHGIYNRAKGEIATRLLRAFSSCDSLGNDSAAKTCYNGVVKDMQEAVLRRPWVLTLSMKRNPDWPCDVLPDGYHTACFSWQPMLWREVLGASAGDMGMFCGKLTDDASRKECYGGIGRVISQTTQNLEDAKKSCAFVPTDEGRAFCMTEVLRALLLKDDPSAFLICTGLAAAYERVCIDAGRRFACHVLGICRGTFAQEGKKENDLVVGGVTIPAITYDSPPEEKNRFTSLIEVNAKTGDRIGIDPLCNTTPRILEARQEATVTNSDIDGHTVSWYKQAFRMDPKETRILPLPKSAGIYGISCDGVLTGYLLVPEKGASETTL